MLGSDDDDSDYEPAEVSEKSEAEVEQKEEMTVIAQLKDKKRQREVDDLWDLMNEEDPILTKARQLKRKKAEEKCYP